MEEDFGLGFNIDLGSLQKGLDQIGELVNSAFNSKQLSEFDSQIVTLNQKISELSGNYNKFTAAQQTAINKFAQDNREVISGLEQLENQLRRVATASLAARFPDLDRSKLNAALGAGTQFGGIDYAFRNRIDNSQGSRSTRTASPTSDQWSPWLNATVGNFAKIKEGSIAGKTAFADMLKEEESTEQAMQRAAKTWDDMVFGAQKATKSTRNWAENLAVTTIRWASISAAIGVAYKTFEFFQQSLEKGLQTFGEYQQQIVQLHGMLGVEQFAGISNATGMSGDILNSGMRLSVQWGDNINDVVQNINLWFKATGDLNSAVALTNESLKFQVVTGTDLEDTYRTLTALSTQLGGVQIASWDKTKFSLKDTHTILNMIYDAAAVAGAGMRDVTSSGKQMGEGLNNAAGILLHALDQDAEALKTLGLNVSQVIALDQALITAMGNTGQEADSVSERMARLVAGFAELSNPSKAKGLVNAIGPDQYAALQGVINKSTGDSASKLSDLVKWYEKLNDQQKNSFSTIVASQRGYQTMGNLIVAFLGSYDKILKAEQDKGSLDRVAEEMNKTFLQQVAQLQGLWQGVVTIVGQELIPVLSNAIKLMAQFISDGLAGLDRMREHLSGEKDINNEVAYLFHPKINKGGYQVIPTGEGVAVGYYNGESPEQQYFDSLRMNALTRAGLRLKGNDYKNARRIILGESDSTQLLHYLFGHQLNSKDFRSYGQVLLPEFAGLPIALAASSQLGLANISKVQDFNVTKDNILQQMKELQDQGLNLPDVKGTGSGKPLTDAQTMGDGLSQLTNQYHAYVSALQDAEAAENSHISIVERQMQLFGPNQKGLSDIVSTYRKQNQELNTAKTALQGYANQFQQQKTLAEAHLASGLKPNTEQYKQWVEVLDRANTSLSEVNKQLGENTNRQQENNMAVLEHINTVAKDYYDRVMKAQDRSVSTATKSFDSGTGSLNAVVKAYQDLSRAGDKAIGNMVKGSVTWKDAMEEMHDKGISAIDDLKSKWDAYTKSIEQSMNSFQSRGIESAFSMLDKTANPDQKADYNYYKEIIKLQKEENDLQIEYADNLKKAGSDEYLKGLAQDLLDMGQATISLDAITAQYVRQVEEIQNSGIFKAFTDSLNAVTGTAGQDLADQLFGNNAIRDQLTGYDQVIAKIQEEKQWYDLSYSAIKNKSAQEQANEKLQIYMLDQQIKKQEQLKKAEEDRLNHPSLFKKFEQTFTKDIINDLVKNMEQQVEQGILGAFMPKKDRALITAMQAHVKGMQAHFEVPSKSFDKMLSEVFDKDIKGDFKNSMDHFHTDVEGPLKKSFEQFHVDISDPSTGLVHALQQFHDDVTGVSQGSIFGASGSGTGTVYFPQSSVLSPTMNDNQVISYIASQALASQTSKALGGSGLNGLDLSGGDVNAQLLDSMGSSGSGFNGIGNLLLSAGGGGSFAGLATAGIGLVSAFDASQHKGNFAIGSLLGTAGALGLAGLAAGGGFLGLFSGAGLAAMMNPAGLAILLGGALLGGSLGGMIGPHYNPSKNPDMFANDGYAQGIANAQGDAYTSATGWVTEDPALKQALGGETELQYLSDFVKAHPGGQGLSGSGLALWNQINQLTVGGTAIGLNSIPNGQVALSTAPDNEAPNIPGTQTDWQTMLNQIGSTTDALQQFEATLNQGSDQLIVGFNQFGSGIGFFPYAWNIPGYQMPANPSQTPIGGPTTGGPTTTPPTRNPGKYPRNGGDGGGDDGGPGGRGNQMQSAYTYSPSYTGSENTTPIVVNTAVNLDGRVVAQNTQAYQLQAQRRGYQRIS